MNGTIHRFYAQSGINALGWSTVWMDFIWLFGLPIQSQYGAVDIELTLQRPDGTTLGTYHGKSEFSESFSMYTNIQLAIGTRLNKSFDEAVGQYPLAAHERRGQAGGADRCALGAMPAASVSCLARAAREAADGQGN